MKLDMSHALAGSVWLMEPHAMRAMVARLKAATPEAIEAAHAAALACSDRQPSLKLVGDVAVIDAFGPISYRRSWFSMYFGGATIEEMQAQLALALQDPAVRTIVFKWHSPGGSSEMLPEFADMLFAARGQGKNIISVCETLCCSAAYWLASQTDVIYVTGSSNIGSVGAYMEHVDLSGMLEQDGVKITFIQHGARKTDGNPYEPISDQARATWQEYVDEIGVSFETAVARGRGVTKKVVAETYGEGESIRGKQALALGMADKVGTFASVIGKLTKTRPTGARAETDPPTPEAGPLAAATVCKTCEEAGCPCKEPACDEDCQTCGPECPCVSEGAEAKARKHLAEAVAADEAAIIATLI